MIFTIYADLDLGVPVQSETAIFHAAFHPDEEACVWADERQPNLLRISYDVEAEDFESAIEASLVELRTVLASMPFDARPVSLNAMTEESQATWTE